jgi:hypothetical protein
VLATTATRATSAAEGTTAKSVVDEPGRPGVTPFRRAGGLLGEAVTEVKALTIEPPYPVNPARADPILPLGVVPYPLLAPSSTANSSSTCSTKGGGTLARVLVL